MERAKKQELIAEMRDAFDGASAIVVTHYKGLTVAEVSHLRAEVRKSGANFKVTKNRLTKLALDGGKFAGIAQMFKGPTAIAYSNDPVAAAKAVAAFAKTNEKLVIVGGSLDGKVMDANGVKALATLPSLDELRGKIVGLLVAPAQRLATLAQAPAAQIARVISAHAEKGK